MGKSQVVIQFNRLSKGQYKAIEQFLAEQESDIPSELMYIGRDHSRTQNWICYDNVRLTIHPPLYTREESEKRKEDFKEYLSGLIGIISEFDWNFEIASDESPPFPAIR